MKYRVEVIVDVMSHYMYREVEADSEVEAREKAEAECEQDIRKFVEAPVNDGCWELETSALSEVHTPENRGTWDFWGERIQRVN